MTQFINDVDCWIRLRAAAKKCREEAYVAVAYFSDGAAKLLPLTEGSRLVVDASERAIRSGQTHPSDLKVLVERGVRVFSRQNLHAKVFVFGSQAFVGSANASNRSSQTLIEAMLVTTDRICVTSARKFVQEHCLDELGPEELDRLQKLYRPPLASGGKKFKTEDGQYNRDEFSPHHTAFVTRGDPPKGSEAACEEGEKEGKQSMEHPRSHDLEHFWLDSIVEYKKGDMITQIITENDGRKFVSPPGKVTNIKRWKTHFFVYLEVRRTRRIALARFIKRVGRGASTQLSKEGVVPDKFAKRILEVWNR